MYWEWSSLNSNLGGENAGRNSVLEKLPLEAAKEVVLPVVKHIVSTIGISQPPQPSPFTTDGEVDWCLQVICFGLSLPLSEHEIIKDCVSIYCDWLSCMLPVPNISVPNPICERSNFYARRMINQLHHLFIPRKGEAQDVINRQAVLCHRVLRVLQNLIRTSESLETETWECVLLFLIAINDALLSPPTIQEDIGDQLCERVLSVLFEVWLLSCERSYPSPPVWKSLRSACQGWRHRASLFTQWNRINMFLTCKVLRIMHGDDYVKHELQDDNLMCVNLSNDATVQTWFRFLHCLGNPVELTQPTIISQTQSFLQFAISSDEVVDPCQHPCLSALPQIFHQAMRGISRLVDAFLGISPTNEKLKESIDNLSTERTSSPSSSPVPPVRRLAKSFSVASSASSTHKGSPRTSLLGLSSHRSKDTSAIPSSSQSSIGSISSSLTHTLQQEVPKSTCNRSRVNSILHMFGPWLFEAALISEAAKQGVEVRRTSKGSAVPAALPDLVDIPSGITIDKYYLGRAEAIGTLCRIICSKKTGEEILPAYLARFYIAVKNGLKDSKQEVLISVLSNSPNLLRLDLDGVSILIPSIIAALESALPNKDALKADLRQSAIQMLLSLLPLPLHFLNVPIKEVLDRNPSGQIATFLQFKPRLADLILNTLQVETDSYNIQVLLGGLLLFISDVAVYEELDKNHFVSTAESPNLLSSENTSLRSHSDYSNSFDDYSLTLPDQGDLPSDSAHALFVRTTYLICHRLISTWKADLAVSLGALEMLNGLARIKIHDRDPIECRRTVKWVCDFICHQCARPPPAHSRDLHSSIVAAFQCISTWLTTHSFILEDKDTLTTVLEVVELGISGSKSLGKMNDPVKMKDEKDLKPVSLRVRDAAEALLAVIFEQVGRYVPTNGTKLASFLNECTLLNHKELNKVDIIGHFRYFVIDHSILLALLEEPFGNDEDVLPTVTMIIRGPTGRFTWNLVLRHLPRYKGKSYSSTDNYPGRPLPVNDVGFHYDIQHSYFPDGIDRIASCKADKAIPPLDALSMIDRRGNGSDQDALEQSRLSIILENQIKQEKVVANMIQEETDESYPNLRTEAHSPPVSQEFQAARLLLTHLGFIAVPNGSDPTLPKLVPLDSRHAEFITELEALDTTSCRTNDTVHIFYVRAGQKRAEEILGNVHSKLNVHPHFLEFLLSLGWEVQVAGHCGWTGNVHSSWKHAPVEQSKSHLLHKGLTSGKASSDLKKKSMPTSEGIMTPGDHIENHGGSLYNGDERILYWADVSSEIAFVVPTGRLSDASTIWHTTNTTHTKGAATNDGTNSASESNTGRSPDESGTKARKAPSRGFDTKIFAVWLESYEDSAHFPSGDLANYTYTGLELPGNKPVEPSLIIFIHALKNGLFRIHIEGQSLRMGFATPLIDGMVVSRRVLGDLVRQTALNMARRKRLENENFQPPHVRRKLKIHELENKFSCSFSQPEFFTHFFRKSPSTQVEMTVHQV